MSFRNIFEGELIEFGNHVEVVGKWGATNNSWIFTWAIIWPLESFPGMEKIGRAIGHWGKSKAPFLTFSAADAFEISKEKCQAGERAMGSGDKHLKPC